MSVTSCKAPGCRTAIPSDQYACHKHWYNLPEPIRSAIWAGFKVLKQGKGSDWVDAHRQAQKYWEGQSATVQ